MEENFWKCECGFTNKGRFCTNCGKEKPYIQENSWTCQCGNKNTGRFCSNCGREKPARDDMLDAVFGEEEKVSPGMNSVNEIRKWSGSWVVLVLSILVSVTLLCSLIGFIMQIVTFGFAVYMVIDIVSLLVGLLACFGFWRAYLAGRKPGDKYSSGGARMLRGVLVFYQVLAYIVMILLLLSVITMFIFTVASFEGLSEILGEVFAELSAYMGFDVMEMLMVHGTTLMIILLVVVIIAFVLVALFFTFARRFARAAVQRLDGVSNEYKSATPAAVFFFIFGIVSLFSSILPLLNVNFLGFDFGMMFGGDWLTIISGIVGALTYIFAGVLAVSFNSAQKRAQM